ncbi:unnamed protein product [Anisakis simplex]|uniref:Helitron_like_N domain-containing protein n=1 Tax=Anisakis simplex TaxID=6269 RepID=A0A0M3K0H8_ANISI|nr:unnamed protein product [Anisakis simplex]
MDESDADQEQDQPALHTRSKYPNACSADAAAIASTSALPIDDDALLFGDDVLLYSAIDDPDYMDFITTLNDPTRYDVVDESEDDPEYNFMCDLECEETPERDELRMDRGTEIPMREVENLLQDLLDCGLTNANSHNQQFNETITQEHCDHNESTATHQYSTQENKGANDAAYNSGHLPQSTSKTKRHKNASDHHQLFTDHITVLMNATDEDLQKISLQSAILDDTSTGKRPQFTSSELEQLQIQMTKNDLYEHSTNQPSTSIFANIKNLEASIVTCHDAVNCETVLFPQLEEPRYKKLNVPLAQTMLVLGRSNALLYPELMPTVRLRAQPSYYQYFTAAEECLLAMGQYMFSDVPHSTSSKRDGRNTLIVRHFLPNKQVSQIRLHMKNFRFSHEPIYTIIAVGSADRLLLLLLAIQ